MSRTFGAHGVMMQALNWIGLGYIEPIRERVKLEAHQAR